MTRGIELEDVVFNVLKKKFKNIEKTGLMLSQEFPELGASADATNESAVFEIKCPSSLKTLDHYIGSK